MGLPRSVAMVRLYPPEIKPPPAAMMSWNVFPLSVLSSSTPPSNPTFGSKSEASRLKLCRNVNRTQQSSKKLTNHPSSRLSLTTDGSSIKRALGGESAGGIGSPELEVTHSGGGPSAFVASQPPGNTGGVNPSKFSVLVRGIQQSGHGWGVGVGPSTETLPICTPSAAFAEATAPKGEADPPWFIARDEAIPASTTNPAEMVKSKQETARNRDDAVARFRFMIMTPVRRPLPHA